METWRGRAALELRGVIEVEAVKPGMFPLGFPTGASQRNPPFRWPPSSPATQESRKFCMNVSLTLGHCTQESGKCFADVQEAESSS